MLSNKYPVIIGIPPHRLSKEARGLLAFFNGQDNHQGRPRHIEDDVATDCIETGGHAKALKSRPATRSRDSTATATQIGGAHPSPYDDFETLLPDGNLAVAACKIEARDEVTVISTPYTQVSDNEDDNLVRESSPVVLGKTRVKAHSRAARKSTVWSTDDEIEGELPNADGRNQIDDDDDDEGPWEVATGKRKERDDADGVASEHQPKWARLTTRVTVVDTPVGDASSAHGKGSGAFIVAASERYRTFDGEKGFRTRDGKAPILGGEVADGPIPTHHICEGEVS